MFKRNVEERLKGWLLKHDRKPLVLRGARQVGKTTLVNGFAVGNFDQYIYLNLERIEDRNFFSSQMPFSEILSAIFLHKNLKRTDGKRTLIFIDEIQNSIYAMEMMRYFYEDAKDLFVISAGSLLETMITNQINFPVGRVEYLYLYPFSFSEYLRALNQTDVLDLWNTIPIPNFAHEKLLSLFHQYALIGGMPEIVKSYIENRDIVTLNPIYNSLLTGYVDDISKYARNMQATNYLQHAMMHAPFASGKRIKFHGFGDSNYGSKEMGEALKTLEKALLINLIYPTTNVMLPILPNYRKSPKLQFLDTGLVNYSVGLQKYYFNMPDLNSFYQGIVAEHIVGQELIAMDGSSKVNLHFWVREKAQSNAEVDFVIPFNNLIIPIEVKAGKAGTLRSMHQFIDETNHCIGVRLSANTFKIEKIKTVNNKNFTLINIPYYLAPKINCYLEKFAI